jgi:hypothetical protein
VLRLSREDPSPVSGLEEPKLTKIAVIDGDGIGSGPQGWSAARRSSQRGP